MIIIVAHFVGAKALGPSSEKSVDVLQVNLCSDHTRRGIGASFHVFVNVVNTGHIGLLGWMVEPLNLSSLEEFSPPHFFSFPPAFC